MGNCHFIDTHCHIDFEAFDERRVELLKSCEQAGILDLVVPGTTRSSLAGFKDLSSVISGSGLAGLRVHFAVGLHPYFLARHRADDLVFLRGLLDSGFVSVVGEIGLDARLPDMDEQRSYFDAQLAMARDFDAPVILHSVKSHQAVLAALKRYSISEGIVHAFSGSLQEAMGFVALGLKIGVGGVITHSRAKKTRETVSKLPLDSLVLETDSPDMAIQGRRKGEGSPLDVLDIFGVLCELRKEGEEVIKQALFNNSQFLLTG